VPINFAASASQTFTSGKTKFVDLLVRDGDWFSKLNQRPIQVQTSASTTRGFDSLFDGRKDQLTGRATLPDSFFM